MVMKDYQWNGCLRCRVARTEHPKVEGISLRVLSGHERMNEHIFRGILVWVTPFSGLCIHTIVP